jgi:mannose-6-phosphate isomerase-like protein (cupin superfamily)
MTNFANQLDSIKHKQFIDKTALLQEITALAVEAGYTVEDIDTTRPWGGFVRFDYKDGDTFVNEFFPGVDPVEARLGNPNAELSPKILLVEPGERLSWQIHNRRAERWVFLTDGAYYKSSNPDAMGELFSAKAGDVVQFEAGECHRLVGGETTTLVAEIWQHTVAGEPSEESDIIRLQDDYKR